MADMRFEVARVEVFALVARLTKAGYEVRHDGSSPDGEAVLVVSGNPERRFVEAFLKQHSRAFKRL
jgi:hypothetical protein